MRYAAISVDSTGHREQAGIPVRRYERDMSHEN